MAGLFQKGNAIGYETRFQKGNRLSNKYKDEYADDILMYFVNADPNTFPSATKWAIERGLSPSTVDKWAVDEKKPRFMSSYAECMKIQRDHLERCGILGVYNEKMTEFLLKNCHGMKERVEQDITATGLTVTIKEVD